MRGMWVTRRINQLAIIFVYLSVVGCSVLQPSVEPVSTSKPVKKTVGDAATVCPSIREPSPSIKNKAVTQCNNDLIPDDYLLIGDVEYVLLQPEGLRLKARVDTGATTSSLGIDHSQRFERDGEPWVRFAVAHPLTGELIELNRRVERIAMVKRHGQVSESRLVVQLELQLGSIKKLVEVNLADRGNLKYPALIGRNYINGTAVVDVSRSFLLSTGASLE